MLTALFQRWWKRRSGVHSVMATYDHAEIARVFARFGGCMGCTDWRADMVRAKIGAFLLAHWDGQNPKPPSPRARRPQRQRCYRQRVRLRPATR